MNRVLAGLMEGRRRVTVELQGRFLDAAGESVLPGRYELTSPLVWTPADPSCAFAVEDVTIGIGFHWERTERQVFRGALKVLAAPDGLTVVNDVSLENYVTSVISSEMSASCPLELLKAHAVISRSWLKGPAASAPGSGKGEGPGEIRRWYGRETHSDFEVCADDHCQRYQGITKALSPAVAEAVALTADEMLLFGGAVCDARFSKCCGGLTERYDTAWDDQEIPYLTRVADSDVDPGAVDFDRFIRTSPEAYCNTRDAQLLSRILPGFDQETRDFFRWRAVYTAGELGEIVKERLGTDLGEIETLEPLARGASGRIFRLRIRGTKGERIVGKELEIRRALSRSHLKSSAFVVDREGDQLVLTGAGWGHGVGLCQIGAAVMASRGAGYREILAHYYPGSSVERVSVS